MSGDSSVSCSSVRAGRHLPLDAGYWQRLVPAEGVRRSAAGRGLPPLVHDLDHPAGCLLEGQCSGVDDRAPEPALDGADLLQLLIDPDQLGVAVPLPAAPERADPLLPDLLEPVRVERQPDDLPTLHAEQLVRWSDATDQGDI